MKKALVFAGGFVVGWIARKTLYIHSQRSYVQEIVDDLNEQFNKENDFSYYIGKALKDKGDIHA